MREKIKILYIAGCGRSGSTLLGNILGSIPGICHVGEFRQFWKALQRNNLCSCGRPITECDFWSNIIKELFDTHGDIIATKNMVDFSEYYIHSRSFFTNNRKDHLRQILTEIITTLYMSIHRETQCKIILDSSKNPSYAKLLQSIEHFDVYLIHLVRDPRAMAYSWTSAKQSSVYSNIKLKKISVLRSAITWVYWNILCELLDRPNRYIFIQYEDFVQSPKDWIERLIEFISFGDYQSTFVSKNETTISLSHTFSGNPDRFSTGNVKVMRDERWKTMMPIWQKMVIQIIVWPLKSFYLLRKSKKVYSKKLIIS